MTDRISQLQDAVDQLMNQFLAAFYYLDNHHDLEPLGPGDKIQDIKESQEEVDAYPPDEFKAGMRELARDMVLKEQEIEFLISTLPGLENSEAEQERMIKDLEDELKVAEQQRLDAVKEKDVVQAKINETLQKTRRF